MKKASKPANKAVINKDEPTNEELLDIEEDNREELAAKPNDNPYLYPNLDDPNFNIKIKNKKEFSDAKYDGKIVPIAQRADELSKVEYELLPQQAFVRNFMSFQTPYNSLLLFHGLGSGKTCSAIGVCEEMRDYLRQMGISKRIIIVASPNVQDNFRLQLFDERNLKNVDGIWTMKGCLGNKLLKEINPTGMKGLTKDKVIQQVKNIISSSYYFVGYLQFSNDIARNWKEGDTDAVKIKNLQNEYSDRLIVIDEVHNIRISNDNDNKSVAKNLMFLVSAVDNLRLLLLSATPMFNSYKEIVWLLNLMNKNDGRATIDISDIFDTKTGNMTVEGKEMLMRKANGYISYVRGENPYTFPFRIYPNEFAPSKTFNTNIVSYPKYQLNGRPINKKKMIDKLSLFLTDIGTVQEMGYNYIIDRLKSREEVVKTTRRGTTMTKQAFRDQKAFGYTDLQLPIEALNIIYPHPDLAALSRQIRPFEPLLEEGEDEEGVKNLDEDPYEDLDEDEDEIAEVDPDLTTVELQKEKEKEATVSEKEEESLSPKRIVVKEMSEEIEDVEKNGPIEVEEPKVLQAEKEEGVKSVTSVGVKAPLAKEQISEGTHKIEGSTVSNEATVKNVVPEVQSSTNDSSTNDSSGGGRKKKADLVQEAQTQRQASAAQTSVVESEEREDRVLNINPRELTGTDGLKRVMTYSESISPMFKGDFEYKDVNNPIFHPDNIGEYSAKIKNVCNYIYGNTSNLKAKKASTKDKRVSDGIILIYSSYIDAGLIPMALALEEMGFTRFGNGGKSLFKTPPTAAVDVETMEPKSKSGKQNFKPARYAMITGDRRLSPNNDADIKIITGKDNINGDEVKVVLLSQAGSEGLDFKAIRQIHILDPWYNVSRIEQIIGRGVRNFSHKDLEFAYRNVQIFLYGTLLSNKEEEAVDLYVYRISEQKAVKIGNVTRILKQVSVDCHINHEQTQLTTANFIDKLEEDARVKQVLSNHETLDNFLVGDSDNSATCDYQSCTVNYECLPDATEVHIEDSKFNLNTYNETFMLVNSDKIIQKIRQLFSDKKDGKFFYKKKTLMGLIKQERYYPTDQIYAALTQMITDNAEYITDKFGRTGHLINIGEYYFFQPSELNYPNISVFDRSRPLDFKHDVVKFEIKSDLVKPVVDKRNIDLGVLIENVDQDKGLKLLNKIFVNYITAVLTSKKNKVSKGENNWYEHCGVIIKKMIPDDKIVPGADNDEREENLKIFLIQHIADELMMDERVVMMNYLEETNEMDVSIPPIILTNIFELFQKFQAIPKKAIEDNKTRIRFLFTFFIKELKSYLYGKIIVAKRLQGLVIFNGPSSLFNDGENNGNLNVFIQKDKVWVPAEPEDKRDLEPVIKKKYKLTSADHLNTYVGFIGFESNKQFMTFKLKDTSDERNTAYRCDQSGKETIITRLNDIERDKVEDQRFFTKVKKGKMTEEEYIEKNKQKTKDGAFELCIREEFTLRSFQMMENQNQNAKSKFKIVWFLDTEKAVYNQFEKREKGSK
jgi:superfamily II DNA or RNA helicase